MAPEKHHHRSPSVSSLSSSKTSAMQHQHQSGGSSHEKAQRLWEQQQLVARHQVLDKLPAFMVFLFNLLLEPLFPITDTFDVYIRKVAILTYGFMSSPCPIIVTWMLIVGSTDEYGFNSKRLGVLLVCGHAALHPLIFNYIYMRRTKRCPKWLVECSIFAAECVFVESTLLVLPIDARSMTLCSLLLVSMMGTKLFPLHAVLHGIIYMLHHFRSLYSTSIPQLAFSWDDDEYPMSEKILYTWISAFPPAAAVLGLFVVVSGYVKRNREAQVTNVMTITIADQLQRYDTKAMGETLENHAEQVNSKLLEAFAGIRTNLDSYRPHIPRYLIDAAIERAEEAEEAEAAERRQLLGIDSQHDGESDLPCDVSEGSLTSHQSTMSYSQRRSESVQPTVSATTTGDVDATHRGLVTVVYLQLYDIDDIKTIADPQFVKEVSNVVEHINVIACTTSASVHHVEDGVMMATWNATKRTGNHEIRACSFAVKAMQMLQEHSLFGSTAAAAIWGGQAVAHFAGSSQKHFVLSHEDMRRHRHLLLIAAQHKTIVCSPSVVRNAEIQFVFGGFAVDNKGKLMYELVEQREEAAEDEWMYALQTPTANGISPYTKLTTAVIRSLLRQRDGNVDFEDLQRLPGYSEDPELEECTPTQLLSSLPDDMKARSTLKDVFQQLAP